LYDEFERVGRLRNAKIGMNRSTGISKGFAFIDFEERVDAEECLKKCAELT
jgi:RNA recognition motif-containing protein